MTAILLQVEMWVMVPSLVVAWPQYTQDLVNCQVGEMISTVFQAGILPDLSAAWKQGNLTIHIIEKLFSRTEDEVCYPMTPCYATLSVICCGYLFYITSRYRPMT